MSKIFCINFKHPYWIDVAVNLYEQNGWEPCYWTIRKGMEHDIKQNFPDAVLHIYNDAVRGIPHDNKHLKFDLPPVDKDLLKQLSFNESIAMDMMSRLDPFGAFSYEERIRYYHNQLRYWLGALNRFEPELVIFSIVPHTVYDYILYALCRLKHIKTIMFKDVSCIFGLSYALETFEEDLPIFTQKYRKKLLRYKGEQVELSNNMEGYFNEVLASGNNAASRLWYVQQVFDRGKKEQEQQRIIKKIFRPNSYWGFLKYRVLCYVFDCPYPRKLSFKIKGKKIENRDISYKDIFAIQKINKNKKKELKLHYDKLSVKPDFNAPYVYMPLRSQPELSSSPLGGVYTHQFLIVYMLSKLIPEEWKIYVKEHPFQFSTAKGNVCTRNTDLYYDISNLPNAELAERSTSPPDLITNSKIVAASGNSGWEAVISGIPVLSFGFAWYNGCEGVFLTPTIDSCKNALATIMSGYTIDHNKVRLFAQTVEENAYECYFSSNDTGKEFIAGKVKNIVSAIHSTYTGLQRKEI